MREHDSSPARGSPPLCVHAPRQIEKAHPELAKQATPKPASRKKQKKKQEKKKKSLFSCCCGDDEEEGEQDATGFAGDLNISAPMSRQTMAPQRRMMRPSEAPSEMRAEDRKKSMVLRGSRRTTAGAVQLKHLVSKKKLRFICLKGRCVEADDGTPLRIEHWADEAEFAAYAKTVKTVLGGRD